MGNGLVSDVRSGPVAPFQVFAEACGRNGRNDDAAGFAAGSLAHTWNARDVSDATRIFMSRANVEALQQGIRYKVYVESGSRHVIGRQSDTELAVIMRSILLQHGRNAEDSTLDQVRALNTEVINFCVPRIVNELIGYTGYLKDVSSLPVPLEHGQIASSKGDRTLQMKSFF